jgi:hypothetical protein
METMILEGVVTTISAAGEVNIAPMGPRFPDDGEPSRFILRPFRTAQTFRNLKEIGEGVLHVTDDVLLLARAALGPIDPPPPLMPATAVRGWVLRDACRYHEFRVTNCDDRTDRAEMIAEIVHTGRLRDFFGLNRAMYAVVEAAILATRTALLPLDDIEAEYRKLAVLVEKTGGPRERNAFALLQQHVVREREKGPRPRPSG